MYQAGEILILGHYLPPVPTPQQLRVIRRDGGMVFQSFNLFPQMTVLQNMIEAPILGRKLRRLAIEIAEGTTGMPTQANSLVEKTAGGDRPRLGQASGDACLCRSHLRP
ncbi:MAG: hypothetical protein KatS3mg067_0125 [Thermosynechococcus sp.]|nr:MAG: hypothetical protein KatS3mg067_0125 [Thermosynechococcus sp.]